MLFNVFIMIDIKSARQTYSLKQILVFFFFLTVFASSCKITRQTAYFETLVKDTTLSGFVNNDFENKIRVGDQLGIVATSLSSLEDDLFNKAASAGGGPTVSGFLVLKDGTVLLHRLGYVTAAGLTRRELSVRLQEALLPYMKEPIVNVQFLNHKVTIMGAVGGPQVLAMPEEQLSLVDVLVKSGDITELGLKNSVMVIREQEDKKIVKYLNLQDASIFDSPWYYVQPNDIVVVRGDLEKITREEKRQRFQTNLGLVTSITSFVILIVTVITR